MLKSLSSILLFLFILFSNSNIRAQIQKKEQDFDLTYKEENVPEYDLPRILESEEGKIITTSEAWINVRRPQILSLFSNLVYGRVPVAEFPVKTTYKELNTNKEFLEGKATRKVVRIEFRNKRGEAHLDVLLITPNQAQKPVPALMMLSFSKIESPNLQPDPKQPNKLKNGVPITELIDKGYAYVAVYHADLVAHNEVEFKRSVHQLFFKTGQSFPKANEWGVIATISWSASRALDYLTTDKKIDANKVALLGHSKLGKATLWATAQDQRFAMAISAQSGCGGAALWRRKYGETLAKISIFPYWLCTNSRKFINQEHDLPIDQHMLLSLIAPRPLYVSSAFDDHWADPRGEYLSAFHASKVYQLFGKKALTEKASPALNQPIEGKQIGYHIRDGGHFIGAYDWVQYLNFMDFHLGEKK